MNLPIYRAKKKDSDEYVIGFYSVAYDIHHYIITHLGVDTKVDVVYQMSTDIHKIDPTTLSISFPDMLDSQGNRIFASLQEGGKGGDIISLDDIVKTAIWCNKTQAIMLNSKSTGLSILSLYKEDIKVIGILE